MVFRREGRGTYAWIHVVIDPVRKHILAPILIPMRIKAISPKRTHPLNTTSSLPSKIFTRNPLHTFLILLYRVFLLGGEMRVKV